MAFWENDISFVFLSLLAGAHEEGPGSAAAGPRLQRQQPVQKRRGGWRASGGGPHLIAQRLAV